MQLPEGAHYPALLERFSLFLDHALKLSGAATAGNKAGEPSEPACCCLLLVRPLIIRLDNWDWLQTGLQPLVDSELLEGRDQWSFINTQHGDGTLAHWFRTPLYSKHYFLLVIENVMVNQNLHGSCSYGVHCHGLVRGIQESNNKSQKHITNSVKLLHKCCEAERLRTLIIWSLPEVHEKLPIEINIWANS